MIVVSAASGAFGRLVIDRLLARCPADRVVAAVRHPGGAADLATRGVEVRLGDYDAPATLRTAFEGAGRLLLISSPELDSTRRAGQHRAAVDAARDAGVGSVVYTSFLGAGTRADGVTAAHHATERTLDASGLPHTLLRTPSTATRSSTRACATPSPRVNWPTAPAGAVSTPPRTAISPRPRPAS
ncbi:NAD(P)H-binding protein [Streptomyces sp. NPDC048256]|uniref:NAD(P)H-binding protein n=1 Tax=Streptomyces sp. NPDC048256 TaxID=3154613 RepID=UPI0033C642BC